MPQRKLSPQEKAKAVTENIQQLTNENLQELSKRDIRVLNSVVNDIESKYKITRWEFENRCETLDDIAALFKEKKMQAARVVRAIIDVAKSTQKKNDDRVDKLVSKS